MTQIKGTCVEINETDTVGRKPLFEYFKADKKLFESSFGYGRYYVVVDNLLHHNVKNIKLERMLRRKDKFILNSKDTIYMNNNMEFELGDIVFFDNGGDELSTQDGVPTRRHHFEWVGSLLRDEVKSLTEKNKKSILKKYRHTQ